jgi:phosphate transport system protein
VMRKIERCGDHCNNIMEEIIFYLDAKVVKHQKK